MKRAIIVSQAATLIRICSSTPEKYSESTVPTILGAQPVDPTLFDGTNLSMVAPVNEEKTRSVMQKCGRSV